MVHKDIVQVKSWRALGPARFSMLNTNILRQISQLTYEQLGKNFLGQIDRSQLEAIRDALPNVCC